MKMTLFGENNETQRSEMQNLQVKLVLNLKQN